MGLKWKAPFQFCIDQKQCLPVSPGAEIIGHVLWPNSQAPLHATSLPFNPFPRSSLVLWSDAAFGILPTFLRRCPAVPVRWIILGSHWQHEKLFRIPPASVSKTWWIRKKVTVEQARRTTRTQSAARHSFSVQRCIQRAGHAFKELAMFWRPKPVAKCSPNRNKTYVFNGHQLLDAVRQSMNYWCVSKITQVPASSCQRPNWWHMPRLTTFPHRRTFWTKFCPTSSLLRRYAPDSWWKQIEILRAPRSWKLVSQCARCGSQRGGLDGDALVKPYQGPIYKGCFLNRRSLSTAWGNEWPESDWSLSKMITEM